MIKNFIYDLQGAVFADTDPNKLCRHILNKLILLCDAKGGYLAEIITDNGRTLRYIAAENYDDDSLNSTVIVPLRKKVDNTLIIPLVFGHKHIGQLCIIEPSNITDDEEFDNVIIVITNKLYYAVIQYNELEILKYQSMNKAKGLLIANVSHELRTPLNAVLGMLALLEDTPLNDYQWSCIDIMRESSLDLMMLINDILDISKLEAGEMQLYPTSVNLRDIIEKSNKIVAQTAYEKKLGLDCKIDSQVPESIIIDSNRFKQMMKNLLSNAVKFTKEGSVKTHVSVATEDDIKSAGLPLKIDPTIMNGVKNMGVSSNSFPIPNGAAVPANKIDSKKLGNWMYLKFTVVDTGIGIDNEHIPHLFKSFSQVDSSITKEYEGTGLGLSITAQLTKLMNGYIGVKSVIGIGSSFYIIIPVQEYLPNVTAVIDMKLLVGKNILVVDDNSKNLMRLTALLDKWGIQYRECESSTRALMSYVGNPKYKFDLGLLDIVMPQMNGNELAAKISASTYPFPMIALSSATQQISSVSPAFSAHINKPYSDEELMEVIYKVLTEKNAFTTTPDKSVIAVDAPENKRESKLIKSTKLKNLSSLFMRSEAETSPKAKKKMSTVSTLSFVPPKSGKNDRNTKQNTEKEYRYPLNNPHINILVVEDQQRNMDMITKMLTSAGYNNIDKAYNGIEAIEKIKQNRGFAFSPLKSHYHVILMDIVMPKMDGITATKVITELFDTRAYRPKIIAVTARITDTSQDEYYEAGIDDIILKPIQNISSLTEKLKNIT